MRPDISTALITIDAAIGGRECQHCAQPLGASPSADFCSEGCQRIWHAEQTGTPPTAPGSTPARPLGWLGQPPPGAIVRAAHEVLDDVAAFVGASRCSLLSTAPRPWCCSAPTLTPVSSSTSRPG